MKRTCIALFLILIIPTLAACSGSSRSLSDDFDAPIANSAPSYASQTPANYPTPETPIDIPDYGLLPPPVDNPITPIASNADIQVLDLRITDTESLVRAYNENADFRAMMDLFALENNFSLERLSRGTWLQHIFYSVKEGEHDIILNSAHRLFDEMYPHDFRILREGVVSSRGSIGSLGSEWYRIKAGSSVVESNITDEFVLLGVTLTAGTMNSIQPVSETPPVSPYRWMNYVFVDITGSQIIWFTTQH